MRGGDRPVTGKASRCPGAIRTEQGDLSVTPGCSPRARLSWSGLWSRLPPCGDALVGLRSSRAAGHPAGVSATFRRCDPCYQGVCVPRGDRKVLAFANVAASQHRVPWMNHVGSPRVRRPAGQRRSLPRVVSAETVRAACLSHMPLGCRSGATGGQAGKPATCRPVSPAPMTTLSRGDSSERSSHVRVGLLAQRPVGGQPRLQ